MKKLLVTSFLLFGFICSATAQNFSAQQKKQEKLIKATYKKGRVTQQEYQKLMHEQDVIKETIEKYKADGILTPTEKNRIYDKLQRAEKRLKRYKTNGEIY
jgi:hypothetical protein